ncbi:MAG TPA: pilus assembly protein N-terminal domain-containing protein [Rhizomicrobium sp.]|nr:pilus assembly protein N-terminal domain-containing protein [Rhizomicrobium sp.]
MRLRIVLLAAASVVCATGAGFAASKAPVKHKPVAHKVVAKHRSPGAPTGVSVIMDQVRIVTFNRPVATVFVGNPMIADATVIDPYHAFVLGKTFGVTNLIALSSQSQTIANQTITVANRSGGVVTLNKGASQYSYACTTAHCEANPLPGDQKTYFDDNNTAISGHQDQAIKAATATASSH